MVPSASNRVALSIALVVALAVVDWLQAVCCVALSIVGVAQSQSLA